MSLGEYKDSIPNQSQVVGQYYDGALASNPPLGVYRNTNLIRSGDMPISHGNKRVNGKYVSGGPWLMRKQETIFSNGGPITVTNLAGRRVYHGDIVDTTGGFHFSGPEYGYTDLKLITDLTNRGAEAWNRMRPAKPDFTLASSTYELREWLPSLKSGLRRIMGHVDARQAARRAAGRSTLSKAGQWHLAIQFGYLPLLNDIRKFAQTHNSAQKRLDALIKREGRPHRARRELSDLVQGSGTVTHSSTVSNSGPHSPSFTTDCYNHQVPWTVTVTTKTSARTWCEGRFRYFLPPGPRTVGWNRRMFRRIYGARITAHDLYSVIPWTWLGDYFTDLGQFVEAISPGVEELLVCDYAYLMRELVWSRISDTSKVYRTGKTSFEQVFARCTKQRCVKMRVKASPFGFGFKGSDLSLRQVGILGALGFSRLP